MAYTKKHARISAAWQLMQDQGCEPWSYEAFRAWSEPRWTDKAVLGKIFPELPWSPDNAEWMGGNDPDAWTIQWSRQYRRTPTPAVNPCIACRCAEKCTKICPARARWWDAKMKELREKWHG